MACGNLLDQESNPCPLHWQADSYPLRNQGSPEVKESESCSVVSDFVISWTVSLQASVHGILQAGILEWVCLFPSPGNLPNPGIKPRSPALQADSLLSVPPGKPREV